LALHFPSPSQSLNGLRRTNLPPARNARQIFMRCNRPVDYGTFSIIILKEIMTNTKEDFAHYCSNRFIYGSAWRQTKQKNFPSDPRNGRAALRLLELESQIEIPDDMWEKIEPHYDEMSSNFLNAVTDTNREVGFKRHPADFTAWLENLHSNLTRG
jgi:hypothetical protein